jgi:hypothetical protein
MSCSGVASLRDTELESSMIIVRAWGGSSVALSITI